MSPDICIKSLNSQIVVYFYTMNSSVHMQIFAVVKLDHKWNSISYVAKNLGHGSIYSVVPFVPKVSNLVSPS